MGNKVQPPGNTQETKPIVPEGHVMPTKDVDRINAPELPPNFAEPPTEAEMESNLPKEPIEIEGLGDITKLVSLPGTGPVDDGDGQPFVVMSTLLVGVNGVTYKQGSVVRASKIIRAWKKGKDKDEVNRNMRKAAIDIARMMDNQEIRKATDAELKEGWVDVKKAPELQSANARIAELEEELKKAREKSGVADPDALDKAFS